MDSIQKIDAKMTGVQRAAPEDARASCVGQCTRLRHVEELEKKKKRHSSGHTPPLSIVQFLLKGCV